MNEDCLCITFDISRTEMAIVDPSRVTIREIYPSIISAKSFIESIKYKVGLQPDAHGSFDAQAKGNIIKGVGNETITGALPIFICQEHWKNAALLMKPILGWVVTLDPIGYDYL